MSETQTSVDVRTLPGGAILNVRTRHSEYRLEVCDGPQAIVTVCGGSFFPQETVTRLNGSTARGGSIKVGSVQIGLRVEFENSSSRVLTSPVTAFEVVEPLPHVA